MKTLKLIKECTDADLAIKESDIVEDVENIIRRMSVRGQGDFKEKAIYLPGSYDYVVGIDNEGCTILIVKERTDCCK